jgi:glycosyltransferase 2 family protein
MTQSNGENRDFLSKYKGPLFTGFVMGFVVLALLMLAADAADVMGVLGRINVRLLPLILLLAPMNYLLRFVKWNLYLRVVGVAPDPKLNRLIFMSGLSMTITPGKVGELLKCYLLKEHVGAPLSRTAPIVMAERLTDAIAMIILASLGFLAYPYGQRVVPVSTALVLVFLIVFQSDALVQFVTGKAMKIRLLTRGAHFVRDFHQNAKKLFSLRNLLLAVGIGVVSWGFEGLVVYLAVMALGGEITILGSFFVVSVSSLLGALSFLPGGLGVAEGSIMAILILTGIGKETAAATTVITRFSTLWLGVAIGIVGLILTQKELMRS